MPYWLKSNPDPLQDRLRASWGLFNTDVDGMDSRAWPLKPAKEQKQKGDQWEHERNKFLISIVGWSNLQGRQRAVSSKDSFSIILRLDMWTQLLHTKQETASLCDSRSTSLKNSRFALRICKGGANVFNSIFKIQNKSCKIVCVCQHFQS